MAVYVDLDSPGSIGLIRVHHKDFAERLRRGLRAKQYGELCEGAGASSRGTMDSHARVVEEAVDGKFEIVNATGVVD